MRTYTVLFVENISGFTQDEGTNGTLDLHEKILATCDEYSPLSVRCRSRTWRDNWKAIAVNYYWLRRKYPPPEPFIIIVNAYSYGCGHGLVSLAKQLGRFNIPIHVANTCDGIYYRWYPWNWRAIASSRFWDFKIKLPPNIQQFHGFYQNKDMWLRGKHPILSPSTEEKSWTELFVEHQWMDDEITWHDHCIQVVKSQAEKWIRNPRNMPRGAPTSEATDSRLAQ